MKRAVDERLRPEQAVFRANRACIDHITSLRIIIEQSIEWQSTVYLNFIDFEKALDSIHRDTLWKLLKYYGTPECLVNIIKTYKKLQYKTSMRHSQKSEALCEGTPKCGPDYILPQQHPLLICSTTTRCCRSDNRR
ncbi:hypothetical protein JTE90_010293 [Oedothorax gibbosus]|uniref:Uncharacterized protein n=1 Tax=Oedothorax gibbosus TaxID=931172 RepID=A0AAV6V4C4_9ARAC|nr:hypothetical protein JTE90_010293 [Oedothorax gibbosus]